MEIDFDFSSFSKFTIISNPKEIFNIIFEKFQIKKNVNLKQRQNVLASTEGNYFFKTFVSVEF